MDFSCKSPFGVNALVQGTHVCDRHSTSLFVVLFGLHLFVLFPGFPWFPGFMHLRASAVRLMSPPHLYSCCVLASPCFSPVLLLSVICDSRSQKKHADGTPFLKRTHGPDRSWDSVFQKRHGARQDMGFGVSGKYVGPDRTWDPVSQKSTVGLIGHGILWCLDRQDIGIGVSKKHIGSDMPWVSASQKTCWVRQDAGFGVSQKRVGPDSTWDSVSQKTCRA